MEIKKSVASFLHAIGVFWVGFWLITACTSCISTKTPLYFKSITKDTSFSSPANEKSLLKIQAGDVLDIYVSSLSKEEDEIFNRGVNQVKGSNAEVGYPVDREGNIIVHRLGKINAAGKTRAELQTLLEKGLTPFMKEPIAVVNFANHFITVLGEIEKNQLLKVPTERIRLLDVLAQSDNISDKGRFNNIMVIRDSDTARQVKMINLEDASFLNSPWYYLEANDIVVVNADEKRISEADKKTRTQQIFTYALSTISLLIVILDRIF